ncbi:MAG: hypothetical protein K8I02_08050, partial [Candidatus Methylomirabilis sp.]|nr:hypothetical protein [Deltaproteobacteria bacterium]
MKTPPRLAPIALGLALLVAAEAGAQEVPFQLRRQFHRPFIDTAVFNALYLGVYTDDSDSARQKESDNGFAPSFYYGNREFRDGEADLDFLLSPSPLYVSYREKRLGETPWTGRLEVFGDANLYREGFYRAGGAYQPTFQYEGFSANFAPSIGRPLLAGTGLERESIEIPRVGRLGLEKLYLEATPAARMYWFGHGRNKKRGETIPEPFAAFAPRLTLEYDAMKWDLCDLVQERGVFFQTWVEYEANDSDRTFGGPAFKRKLDGDFWRAGGFAEAWGELWRLRGSYLNLGQSVEWELKQRGDRVRAYNVRGPIGHNWAKWRAYLGLKDILLPANFVRPYFEVLWTEGAEGPTLAAGSSDWRAFVGAGVH